MGGRKGRRRGELGAAGAPVTTEGGRHTCPGNTKTLWVVPGPREAGSARPGEPAVPGAAGISLGQCERRRSKEGCSVGLPARRCLLPVRTSSLRREEWLGLRQAYH